VVSSSDGLFYSSAHAFMAVFRVSDVDAVPCVRGVASAVESECGKEK
jgi:hypothetical protein